MKQEEIITREETITQEERERLAYHEASHAVVARFCDFHLEEIYLNFQGWGEGAVVLTGHVCPESAPLSHHLEWLEKQVLRTISGYLAGLYFEYPDMKNGIELWFDFLEYDTADYPPPFYNKCDYEKAIKLIEKYWSNPELVKNYLRSIEIKCILLFKHKEIWQPIEKLAKLLLKRKTLDGVEAEEFIEDIRFEVKYGKKVDDLI